MHIIHDRLEEGGSQEVVDVSSRGRSIRVFGRMEKLRWHSMASRSSMLESGQEHIEDIVCYLRMLSQHIGCISSCSVW